MFVRVFMGLPNGDQQWTAHSATPTPANATHQTDRT